MPPGYSIAVTRLRNDKFGVVRRKVVFCGRRIGR